MKIKISSCVDCRASVNYLANSQASIDAMVLPGGCTCTFGSCCSCSCAIIVSK